MAALTSIPNDNHMLSCEIDIEIPPGCMNDVPLEGLSSRDIELIRVDQTTNSGDEDFASLSEDLPCFEILKRHCPCLSGLTPPGTLPLRLPREMRMHAMLCGHVVDIIQNLGLRRK